MFLSKLAFDPMHNRGSVHCLRTPYTIHGTIMRGFGKAINGKGAREEFGILHRVEMDAKTSLPCVLVQSRSKPDWNALEGLLASCCVKEINPQFADGQILWFKLRANPSVSKRSPEGRRYRQGILDPVLQEEWLRERGSQHGFEVRGMAVVNGDVFTFNKEEFVPVHTVADFEGVLVVSNASDFSKVFVDGIGPGKYCGLGMLCVLPRAFR